MTVLLKSKKAQLLLIILGVITVAFFFGKIPSSEYTELLKWLFGLFSGGEGIKYVAQKSVKEGG